MASEEKAEEQAMEVEALQSILMEDMEGATKPRKSVVKRSSMRIRKSPARSNPLAQARTTQPLGIPSAANTATPPTVEPPR